MVLEELERCQHALRWIIGEVVPDRECLPSAGD